MRKNRWLIIFIVGFSGGIIYLLPYYSKYLLYDYMREYFNLSHTEFGILQVVYGITGFLLYYPSGLLADRFSIKNSLFISMILSGILGFLLLFITSFKFLVIIFILFSITTNFIFWVPSLKLVMNLGDVYEQKRVLGVFEGSKGIAGLFFGVLSFLFINKMYNFEIFIILYSVIIIICGFITFFLLKKEKKITFQRTNLSFLSLIKEKKILLIGLTMFFYYIIYTNLVYLNLYLGNIYEITPEIIILFAFFRIYLLKILISPISGYLVDKMGSAIKVFTINFFILLILQSMLLLTPSNKELISIIFINILLITILSIVFVSIKFASLTEIGIKKEDLGKTIGFISLIAYFPDIIYSKFIGEILDKHKNMSYKYIFSVGIITAILGLITCLYLLKYKHEKEN